MHANHIVHLSTVHHPYDTRILYRECISLAEHHYMVSLLVCYDQKVDVDGVNVINFPLPNNRRERMTTAACKFIRMAIELDADLYHFHDPELAPWMLILRLRGKKVIFDVHENILGSLSDRSWIPSRFRPAVFNAAKFFLPMIMKPFQIIFAERSYPEAYPWVKEYTTVCNFPKIEHFPVNAQADKFNTFSIVYLGSITEPRGIIDILDALSILQRRDLIIDLYLIGKVHLPKQKDLIKLIDERHLIRVKVLGYTPQPEALKIVSRCHLGLAVLHPVKNYFSSYPTKIFEYMGCNIPFITSNFPLYQEVVDKWQCGDTVQPQNPVQLAEKIEFFYSNRNILIEMGKRGRQAVEKEYNWKFEEQKLLTFYKQLINLTINQ